jgi:hypothetical protein
MLCIYKYAEDIFFNSSSCRTIGEESLTLFIKVHRARLEPSVSILTFPIQPPSLQAADADFCPLRTMRITHSRVFKNITELINVFM